MAAKYQAGVMMAAAARKTVAFGMLASNGGGQHQWLGKRLAGGLSGVITKLGMKEKSKRGIEKRKSKK